MSKVQSSFGSPQLLIHEQEPVSLSPETHLIDVVKGKQSATQSSNENMKMDKA